MQCQRGSSKYAKQIGILFPITRKIQEAASKESSHMLQANMQQHQGHIYIGGHVMRGAVLTLLVPLTFSVPFAYVVPFVI